MRMNHKIALLLLVAGWTVGLRVCVAEPITVAVYGFTAEGNAQAEAGKITALVTAELAGNTNATMIERAQLSKALDEQAFGGSGMVNSDVAAKIGAITGVKVLVSGQVFTADHKLVIIANVVGTETGRLFAVKTEGSEEQLLDLTAALSQKIGETIGAQATNLVAAAKEPIEVRVDRLAKNLSGTNRPSVSVTILWGTMKSMHCNAAEVEFGAVLLKAGFKVVDQKSDVKPDVEITGLYDHSEGVRRGELYSFRSALELKAQRRRTGEIISFDRQECVGTDSTKVGADRAATIQATDELVGRMLPILAK